MDEISLLSESVERAALADLHAAAPEVTRRLLGLRLETIGTALVSLARYEPNLLLNRTIGLGVEAPDVRETVTAIASRYADNSGGRSHATPTTAADVTSFTFVPTPGHRSCVIG